MNRDKILQSLRSSVQDAPALPELSGDWIQYEDRAAQFVQAIENVGGQCLLVNNVSEINRALDDHASYPSAKKVFSNVEGMARANIALSEVADPHDIEDLDFAIVAGEFGVAENGAIWVTDEAIKHRVALFLCQHLALTVSRQAIVDNMHQAYERLELGSPHFGTFLAGPSKTADIEQSLVIGAHGPRSLTVFVTP